MNITIMIMIITYSYSAFLQRASLKETYHFFTATLTEIHTLKLIMIGYPNLLTIVPVLHIKHI